MTTDGRAEAVATLRSSNNLSAPTRGVLSEIFIAGIIAAEREEMGYVEAAYEYAGGERWAGGLGPGQVYESAHRDVLAALSPDLQRFIRAVNSALAARGEPASVALSENWADNVKDPRLSNFFILGYLAICIDRSQKPGRSSGDALRYGIVNFHGARATVIGIQRRVNAGAFSRDEPIPWSSVENHINNQGSSREKELLNYVAIVLTGGVTR